MNSDSMLILTSFSVLLVAACRERSVILPASVWIIPCLVLDPVPAYTVWPRIVIVPQHPCLCWSRGGIMSISCLSRSRAYFFQLDLPFLCSLYLPEPRNPMDVTRGCPRYVAEVLLGLVWVGAFMQQSRGPTSVLVSALVCVWQHVMALGSSRMPLQSVMSAVGQLVCAAGRGEKMGEELRGCPRYPWAACIRGGRGLSL